VRRLLLRAGRRIIGGEDYFTSSFGRDVIRGSFNPDIDVDINGLFKLPPLIS
jgi:hypothetical protein